ncbi:hypothetical protein Ancab_019207 [Ancistrocladus abbreviatus]
MALSNEVHVPQKIPQTNPNYLPPDMSIPHDAILLSNPLVHSKVGMGMHMQSVPSAPLSAPVTEVLREINSIPINRHSDKMISDRGYMVAQALPLLRTLLKLTLIQVIQWSATCKSWKWKTLALRDISSVPLNLSA